MWTGRLPILPPATQKPGGAEKQLAVVALGGGHGLSASLQALKHLTNALTAIVTVADDGGSSGRIRDEFGVLPPGDLRMALAALCDDNEWGRTWRDVMQHRFSSRSESAAELDGHAMGNLLIVSLWELLQNPVAGLQWAGALLGARGTVLPMSTTPLTIEGDVLSEHDGKLNVQLFQGQAQLAKAGTTAVVSNVRVLPEDAPACTEALEAIDLADWVILGPGSWYTSVLPHLLLPEIRDAIERSTAKRALIMNLRVQTDETGGMSATDHLKVIKRYAPNLLLDVVVADPVAIEDVEQFATAVQDFGAQLVLAKLGSSDGSPTHDPIRLAATLSGIFM